MRDQRIKRHQMQLTASGGAGTAWASGTSIWALNGRLWSVQVEYSGCPATTDVNVESVDPSDTLLQRNNTATANVFYPRNIMHTNLGSEVGAYEPFVLNSEVKAVVNNANDGSKVILTFFYI